LIYGVPFYGYEYIATCNQPGDYILSRGGYIFLKNIQNAVKAYGRQWDSYSNTPYYYFVQDNTGKDTKKVLDNCDKLSSTKNDYRVTRTVDNGTFKCVVSSSGDIYMLLRNESRWKLSPANYVCADVKAPVGKTMVLRLMSNVDCDYVSYEFTATGTWQHVIVPFKQLHLSGAFNFLL
jgi:hypothetical protein